MCLGDSGPLRNTAKEVAKVPPSLCEELKRDFWFCSFSDLWSLNDLGRFGQIWKPRLF